MVETKAIKKKYPNLEEEVKKIDEVFENITNYFASIINKGDLYIKDLFFLSVLSRTNQCIISSVDCLKKDLQFPLPNIIRQLIEIYAVNNYILNEPKNFKKAVFGKHKHAEEDFNMPNILTLVQKLGKVEKELEILYNEYSEISHPNSKSVFSVFNPIEEEGQFLFEMTSYSKKISENNAYHLIRNIAGLANRIYISSRKINPLKKYLTKEDIEGRTKKII